MTDNERIILGIDPGTNVMGYGVLKAVGNKAQLIENKAEITENDAELTG